MSAEISWGSWHGPESTGIHCGETETVRNRDPILFGLYGDAELGPVVYHHGAGFRHAPERVARLRGVSRNSR